MGELFTLMKVGIGELFTLMKISVGEPFTTLLKGVANEFFTMLKCVMKECFVLFSTQHTFTVGLKFLHKEASFFCVAACCAILVRYDTP